MLTVLTADGTHRTQTGWELPDTAEYAVKFIQKPAARIGGKEVAIESKELSITSLRREMEQTADEGKRASLQEQIDALNLEIRAIYQGTETEDGLYTQMREAVETALALEDTQLAYQSSLQSQQEIERRFALAMGDMLIDGYWSNTNYAPGLEELLYLEACEVMERLSKPAVSYNVSIQNLSCVSGYEQEVFTIGMLLRIWDEALSLNDKAYISKLIEHLDAPEKDSVSITNDLTSIGTVSLDSIFSQITGIADTVKQKKALYDRAKAISDNGSIPVQRLEGMIDV